MDNQRLYMSRKEIEVLEGDVLRHMNSSGGQTPDYWNPYHSLSEEEKAIPGVIMRYRGFLIIQVA